MLRRFVVSAGALAQHAATLERLHAPVATARRIGFIACGSAPATPLIASLAHTFGAVPGRSVSVTASTDRGAGHNADVVLTDLGAFTALSDATRFATAHHALCLVTTTGRSEADPTIALADVLADEHGVNCLVACVSPAEASAAPRESPRWTRLMAKRRPERLFIMAKPFAVATLAGALLDASTRTAVLTGAAA